LFKNGARDVGMKMVIPINGLFKETASALAKFKPITNAPINPGYWSRRLNLYRVGFIPLLLKKQ